MQSDDSSGVLIDSDGLAPVKPVQPKTGKRGRKQDNTLPPSRSRDVQRAFRARRAEKISGLEARVKHLEDENAHLRSKLGMKEAEPWTLAASSSVLAPVDTPAQTATQREGYANQFDATPAALAVPTQTPRWIVPPNHLNSTASSSSTTPGYDPSFPSPNSNGSNGISTSSSSVNLPTWAPSIPSSSTSQSSYPRSIPSPLPLLTLPPPPPLTDDQRTFLTTCCSVPPSDLPHATLNPTIQPYHHFCVSLMQGLLVTGKGRSLRMSLDPTPSPSSSSTDIPVSISGPGGDFEDSPSSTSIRAGFVSALVAWSALQGLHVSPSELGTYLVQSAGGPGDGSTGGGGTGVRCEKGHGVIVSEGAVRKTRQYLERSHGGAGGAGGGRAEFGNTGSGTGTGTSTEYDPTNNFSFGMG